MSRLSAACSRAWAVQPAWRASENVAGNRSGDEADAHQHGRRVELDVGLERAIGMLLGQDPQGDVLDLDRELEPVGLVLHPLGDRAQRGGPRVVGAVDAVAEAHQPLAAIEGVADPGLGVIGRADLASWSTTSDGAPPWSGPFIVPIAPATADAMSDRVEVMTRAVNVEALKPCSAPTMK